MERTARLIRSKGVGVYFVTQAPTDVPSPILAQLGNRVQHALRAFTPEDADALRKTARTFPMTDFYDVEKTITSLGTGEALVTVLSPKGVPTPLAATRLLPPDSLMAPIDEVQFRGRIAMSPLAGEVRRRPSTATAPTSGSPARIAAARQAAVDAAVRAGVDPTTATGMNTMTPAQQQREVARQQREMEAAQARAQRAGRAAGTGPAEGGRGSGAGASADDRQRHPDRRQGRQLAARAGHHPRCVRDAVRRWQVALSTGAHAPATAGATR